MAEPNYKQRAKEILTTYGVKLSDNQYERMLLAVVNEMQYCYQRGKIDGYQESVK